jgi:hypothetical protein
MSVARPLGRARPPDHLRRPIERHGDPVRERELDSLGGFLPFREPALGQELLGVEVRVDVGLVVRDADRHCTKVAPRAS